MARLVRRTVSSAATCASSRPTVPASLRTNAVAAARQASTTTATRCATKTLPTATARFQQRPAPSTIAARRARFYSQDIPAEDHPLYDFEQMKQLTSTKSDKIIVDVREPAELAETGRIPGAVNIPIKTAPDSFHIAADEFEDRFGYPRPPKDADVIFYCRSGVRSRAAAGLAKEAGWSRVAEYPGSWLDWSAKGGKVERK